MGYFRQWQGQHGSGADQLQGALCADPAVWPDDDRPGGHLDWPALRGSRGNL